MRDTAGSAAAPAARWRKFRRGSFILNLPLASHHSITSSVSACTVGGTVKPSVVGLEIDDEFEFYGSLHRKFLRLRSLQDAIDIPSRAPEDIRRVGRVRHQAAFLDELPV